jgi:hypothetical protein
MSKVAIALGKIVKGLSIRLVFGKRGWTGMKKPAWPSPGVEPAKDRGVIELRED